VLIGSLMKCICFAIVTAFKNMSDYVLGVGSMCSAGDLGQPAAGTNEFLNSMLRVVPLVVPVLASSSSSTSTSLPLVRTHSSDSTN
jgi:hypothetical protein